MIAMRMRLENAWVMVRGGLGETAWGCAWVMATGKWPETAWGCAGAMAMGTWPETAWRCAWAMAIGRRPETAWGCALWGSGGLHVLSKGEGDFSVCIHATGDAQARSSPGPNGVGDFGRAVGVVAAAGTR